MIKYFIYFLFAIPCLSSNAQTAEDSVRTTINQLFIAMKQNDSALLVNCFADSAILQTIKHKASGKVSLENESLLDFATFIAHQKKGLLDERISIESIHVDANLASAWVPYEFYYNSSFSHCGVNSFQLVRMQGGWKIIFLVDTRRKTGCK